MAFASDKRLYTFDYAELDKLEFVYMFGLFNADNTY